METESMTLDIRKKREFAGQQQLAQLERALAAYSEFLRDFEIMFNDDWDYTESAIKDGWVGTGTFLDTGMSEYDESDNWACRGALLASYRKLKATLGEPLPWEDPRRPENYHLRASNGEIS